MVEKGDTLWDLSETYLGTGSAWKKLSAANGNPEPRALKVGKELVIPR